VLSTVFATEAGTAAAIVAVLPFPLVPALIVLSLFGMMLNGTSSVLYGTVPKLAHFDRADRAFALFYTGTTSSGTIAPVLFDIIGDAAGADWASAGTAATAALTLPIASAPATRLQPLAEIGSMAR